MRKSWSVDDTKRHMRNVASALRSCTELRERIDQLGERVESAHEAERRIGAELRSEREGVVRVTAVGHLESIALVHVLVRPAELTRESRVGLCRVEAEVEAAEHGCRLNGVAA